MNAREMHYDAKQKLNKIDSQKFRDLVVPEIDWKLNEAQETYVKVIAQPRSASQLGFEINQRTINDIRTIVVDQKFADGVVPNDYDATSQIVALPANFWFLAKIGLYGTKNNCKDVALTGVEVQHNDEHEVSPFNRSSFEWRRVNMRFNDQGLRIFNDGTFTITKVCFEYIKRPRKIQNAQDFDGGTYTGLDGVVYTGSQSCELPEGTHSEIVDLAVLLMAADLGLPTYPLKKDKERLTDS